MNLAHDHGVGRTSAALLGSLPLSLAFSVLLARGLPLAADLRFAIGFFAFFAIWPAAICLLFLMRSGVRAWAVVAGSTAALALLAAIFGAGR